MGEWFLISLLLVATLSIYVWALHKRGMTLSTTPFIDPAGVIQVTAWDFYNAACFHKGIFPLWNPYTGLGQPHLANFQTAVFYPLKVFFYPWGNLWSHDLYLFARFVLLGLGIFVLLRAIGTSKPGSIFSSLAFSCGGYVLWFINLVELNNQLLTPFLMIALARLGSGFSWKRFLAVSALVWADILGGHPEGIFITLLFSSLFACWMLGLRRVPYAAALWCCASAVGAMGSAIVIFPFVEYFTKSWNFHFAGMGFLHLGLKAPLTLLSPYFSPTAGGPLPTLPDNLSGMSLRDFFKLPYSSFQLNAGFPYLGIITSSLAAAALFNLKRLSRGAGFFAAFWFLSAGLSMGIFPFNLLAFIPPFHVTNNAKFYFAEITFCACALGGMGLDIIERRKRTILIFLCFFTVLAVALNFMLAIRTHHLLIQMLPPLILCLVLLSEESGKSIFRNSQQNDMFIRNSSNKIKLLAVLFLICELAIMKQTVKPYLPLNWHKIEAQWIKEIAKEISSTERNFPAGFRFQVKEDFLLPPNLNLIHGLADVRSSDAMFPSKYFYWINELGGIADNEVFHDFYPRYYTRLNEQALNSTNADLIGLRYLVTEKPLPSSDVFIFKTQIEGINIYERMRVCGLIYLLEENGVSCASHMNVEETKEDKIVFRLNGGGGAKGMPVVINTLDYPGWTIRDKTKNTALQKTQTSLPLLAFYPKTETTRCEAVFAPVSFKVGLWVSLCTILFAIIFVGVFVLKRRFPNLVETHQ